MANSDIIKIGFDYRASLEQFEKETNGVFDGISNKAGKQKITIQLDAKDDKVIDKIKELQKLKLDKFTFEFGDSGLKEQLQTFDKLENKINEIISLSKGIDLSFNTKNKTEAYNQLKKYADAFKEYYGNEEAMATNAGAKAGYAYYKAYEEALRKGVAQSKLEKVTVDFDVNDSIFSKERIVENRIKEFENFQKYGNADESNLIAEITLLENRLLKFNSAYSQVKANLGNAPITPEITKNIEEYVRLLEIAESRAKDAELFGYPSEDINSDKDLANMYLDFAKEDATAENKKYIESLKQEETQAIATAEAEQKLAEAQNETVSNTSNSNNSQIEELKSDIQEVKTELGDVKDRISSIESNGFENVRDDVEKTKESVKELNSELAEIFDDFCKVFHVVSQFHNALFGRFSGFGFHSNLMLQIGERTNFIIALCSNLQILDSCPLLKSGTVLKFFIRGINEPAGRVVFFRNDRFSLMLHFDAFPDTFLCVFLTKRFRTATDKTFFIQRTERDVFGSTFFKRFPFDFISFGSH